MKYGYWDFEDVDMSLPLVPVANAYFDRQWFFVYQQSTGVLAIGVSSHDDAGSFTAGAVLDIGYSGFGPHQDNPASEHLVGKGPIPRGTWYISEVQNRTDTGPLSVRLLPQDGWEVPGGRSGFYVHGDNRQRNHTASRGCPIFPRYIRQFLSNYVGRRFIVVE